MSPVKEKWGGGWKIFEKITAENFPNLMKTINPEIQEVQKTTIIRNMKKKTKEKKMKS